MNQQTFKTFSIIFNFAVKIILVLQVMPEILGVSNLSKQFATTVFFSFKEVVSFFKVYLFFY